MLYQESADDNCVKNAMQTLPVHFARMIEHVADVQF